jgi:hypothetical protein
MSARQRLHVTPSFRVAPVAIAGIFRVSHERPAPHRPIPDCCRTICALRAWMTAALLL